MNSLIFKVISFSSFCPVHCTIRQEPYSFHNYSYFKQFLTTKLSQQCWLELGKRHKYGFLPSREKCQDIMFCLTQGIFFHWICGFIFDALSELAWILPLMHCFINRQETITPDGDAVCIFMRDLCWQVPCFSGASGTFCLANWRLSG